MYVSVLFVVLLRCACVRKKMDLIPLVVNPYLEMEDGREGLL
jgi:hypothetical protein